MVTGTFPQTGYWISDDTIWEYFIRRGGVKTFGYPASRKFLFRGSQVQFFQRRVIQIRPDGSTGQLNILDKGLLEYNIANGATFPNFDEDLVATAPPSWLPKLSDGAAGLDKTERSECLGRRKRQLPRDLPEHGKV